MTWTSVSRGSVLAIFFVEFKISSLGSGKTFAGLRFLQGGLILDWVSKYRLHGCSLRFMMLTL